MIYRIKLFFKRLFRSCSAFKLAFKNDDWDYYYLLELIEWKLKRISKELKEDTITCESPLRHRECEHILQVLQRVMDGEYCSERHKELLDMQFNIDSEEGFKYTPLPEELEEESTKELLKSHTKEEQDWNLLFNLLKKHLRSFWV